MLVAVACCPQAAAVYMGSGWVAICRYESTHESTSALREERMGSRVPNFAADRKVLVNISGLESRVRKVIWYSQLITIFSVRFLENSIDSNLAIRLLSIPASGHIPIKSPAQILLNQPTLM